jgi:hypothetical protein
MNLDCIELKNPFLTLIASRSAGPRILSIRRKGVAAESANLLAELPDQSFETPRAGTYHFYGGHRLWLGPEDTDRTYMPDDTPLHLALEDAAVTFTQPADPFYGIEKSLRITLAPDAARVTIDHTLTNRGSAPVTGAPWAITMLKPGGTAILPQVATDTGLLPNRSLTLWPYTDIRSPHIHWGNRYIFVYSNMQADLPASKPGGSLKIGFPNPCGWLAYWLEGTLFVKRAAYQHAGGYLDNGSSSQCYCCGRFLELETLGPAGTLPPGSSLQHTETWEIFADVPFEPDEDFVQSLVEGLQLGE